MRASPLSDTAAPGEVRRLATLAWPVVLGSLATMGMGAVDVAMVGRLGAAELAALELGNLWFWSVIVVALGILRALDPLVAQGHGAADTPAVASALVHGVALSLAMAPPVAGVVLVAAPGLLALGQPAELVGMAGSYTTMLAFGVPGMLVFGALRQVLQGIAHMHEATIAVLVANVLNFVLDGAFIHGWFGFPRWAVAGCGLATAVSQTAMVLGLLWIARKPLGPLWRSWRQVGWRPVARMAWLGLPLGLQSALETWAFMSTGLLVGWIGTEALAGHAIALNVCAMAFMIPHGIGAAAATRLGALTGAGEPLARAAWSALAFGAACTLAAAVLFLAFPSAVARLYSPEPAVIAAAAPLIPLVGAFQLFDGTQAVANGILRGAGDLQVPALIGALAFWGVGIPAALVLAFPLGLGAPGVWLGLAAALATAAVILTARVARVVHLGGVRVKG